MTYSPFGPVMAGNALPVLQMGLRRLTVGGWIQHCYWDAKTGAHCSLGVMSNHDAFNSTSAATPLLARAIRESGWIPSAESECVGEDGPDTSMWSADTLVVNWNDEDGRTWPEVKAMWEAAIKIAETFAPHSPANVVPTGKLEPTAE